MATQFPQGSIVYSYWECGFNWYKKTLWSDKHVHIILVTGKCTVAAAYMICFKGLLKHFLPVAFEGLHDDV